MFDGKSVILECKIQVVVKIFVITVVISTIFKGSKFIQRDVFFKKDFAYAFIYQQMHH